MYSRGVVYVVDFVAVESVWFGPRASNQKIAATASSNVTMPSNWRKELLLVGNERLDK